MNSNHSEYSDHRNDQVIALASSCFLLVIALTTVVSNGILLLALILDPIKQLRTPPMYLVTNRAIADFLTGILADPFYVLYYITIYHGNPNNGVLLVARFLSLVTVQTALWTTVALVCERYLCIKKPFRYLVVASKQNIVVGSAFIWVYSATLGLIQFTDYYSKTYKVFETHVNLSVPSVIITTLFYSIYKFLKKQRYNDIMRFLPSQSLRRKELLSKAKQDKKMLNTVIVIIILLVACFAPYVVFVHIDFFTQSNDHWSYDLLNLLSRPFVFLNSGINPFVYAWRHNVFRRSIQRVLCRGRSVHDIG